MAIIDPHNGMSPDRRPAIIWTNAKILLIGPLETNSREIVIEIQTLSFKKMRLKISFAKWQPFWVEHQVVLPKIFRYVNAWELMKGCRLVYCGVFVLVRLYECHSFLFTGLMRVRAGLLSHTNRTIYTPSSAVLIPSEVMISYLALNPAPSTPESDRKFITHLGQVYDIPPCLIGQGRPHPFHCTVCKVCLIPKTRRESATFPRSISFGIVL